MNARQIFLEEQISEFELMRSVFQSFRYDAGVEEKLTEINEEIQKLKVALEVEKLDQKLNTNR